MPRLRDFSYIYKLMPLMRKSRKKVTIEDVRHILEDSIRDRDSLEVASGWISKRDKTLKKSQRPDPKQNMTLNELLTFDALDKREKELMDWEQKVHGRTE